MPLVSVTRLRIRSARYLPHFWLDTVRSARQVKRAEGFLTGMLIADRNRAYWTLSVWRDEMAMRKYVRSGAHRRAVARLPQWCDEATVVHFRQEGGAIPDMSEAEAQMRTAGRALKLRFPNAAHAGLAIAPSRPRGTVHLKPAI